jgi:hypothetical protein
MKRKVTSRWQVADFGFCVQLTDDQAARQSVVGV